MSPERATINPADITERLRQEFRVRDVWPGMDSFDFARGETVPHPVAAEAAAEIERLRTFLDPDATFRDIEMKVRDGSIDLRAVLGDETQPAFRFLAAIMLHFVLGEGGPDDLEEPPNYRSGELVLKPGGGFEEIHAAIEIIKPGGKSSHQIRMDLEAEVAELRERLGDDNGRSQSER